MKVQKVDPALRRAIIGTAVLMHSLDAQLMMLLLLVHGGFMMVKILIGWLPSIMLLFFWAKVVV